MSGRSVITAAVLVIFCLAGCGGGWQENSAEDQERAREILNAALDAWQTGQVAGLSQRVPPIRFSDDDFASGLQLTQYESTHPDQPVRPFQNVEVELVLKDRQGRTIHKDVTYQVNLKPTPAVLRSDN